MIKASKYTLVILALTLGIGACKNTQVIGKGKSKKELTESAKKSLTKNYFDAILEKQLANFKVALEKFENCIDIDPNHHASMYEMASIYFHLGNDELAYELIQKAVNLNPKNEYYRLLLADLHTQSGKHDEAAKIFKSLIDDFPKKIEYYYEWASALLYDNEFEKAISVYNNLEMVIGISEEISIQKQKIYLSIDKASEAISEIEKLIKAFPNENRYYGLLAEIYTSQGMNDKAAELYKKMQEINPNDPFLQLSLADHYKQKGEQSKADEQLKKAFSNPDLNIDAKINILLSYYMVTETDPELINQAFELLDILVEVHSDEAKSHAMQGDFLYREGKLELARGAFKNAIKLDPSRYLVWSQLLITDSELGNYDSLITESELAMELFPNQPMVYFLNGIAKNHFQKYEEAIEVLNTGLIFAREPYIKIQMLTTLGDVYNEIESFEKSDNSFEKALTLDPKNALVMNNYAYYLSLRKNELEKAAEMSKKSLGLEPDNPSYLDTYGWILYQQGNYEAALEWLKDAVEKSGGQSGVVLEHYGDVLWQLSKTDEAITNWKKAVEAGGGTELLEKKLSDKQLYE